MTNAYERGIAALPGIRKRCAEASSEQIEKRYSDLAWVVAKRISEVDKQLLSSWAVQGIAELAIIASHERDTDLPLLCDALEAARERIAALEKSLKLCSGIIAGETLNKEYLESALQSAREVLKQGAAKEPHE